LYNALFYPAILSTPAELSFVGQYAFRPTGSTAAAIISSLDKITNLLVTEPYVIVISLDFSKAFDRIRHKSLMDKMAAMDLPDHINNWLINFFNCHSHCVEHNGEISTLKEITASVIQGSAVGPAAYVVYAADLQPVNRGNDVVKYADDTYNTRQLRRYLRI
jgi:ribonucleases P/MRP protein subunit RPP40